MIESAPEHIQKYCYKDEKDGICISDNCMIGNVGRKKR